jgi:hypothetical protein
MLEGQLEFVIGSTPPRSPHRRGRRPSRGGAGPGDGGDHHHRAPAAAGLGAAARLGPLGGGGGGHRQLRRRADPAAGRSRRAGRRGGPAQAAGQGQRRHERGAGRGPSGAEVLARAHLAQPRARGDREAMRGLLPTRRCAVAARTRPSTSSRPDRGRFVSSDAVAVLLPTPLGSGDATSMGHAGADTSDAGRGLPSQLGISYSAVSRHCSARWPEGESSPRRASSPVRAC